MTALKILIYVALVSLLALIVAVAVAYANLPSYLGSVEALGPRPDDPGARRQRRPCW